MRFLNRKAFQPRRLPCRGRQAEDEAPALIQSWPLRCAFICKCLPFRNLPFSFFLLLFFSVRFARVHFFLSRFGCCLFSSLCSNLGRELDLSAFLPIACAEAVWGRLCFSRFSKGDWVSLLLILSYVQESHFLFSRQWRGSESLFRSESIK